MVSAIVEFLLEKAAGFVMIPVAKQIILKYIPVSVLNRARLSFVSVDFVESPEMRKSLVVKHIRGDSSVLRSFLRSYWSAVHAGVIECAASEMEQSGHYHNEWIESLLDKWHEMGLLPYLKAGDVEFIARADLKRVFSEHRIRFPVTWR